MTVIYYTYFNHKISNEIFETRLSSLPPYMRENIRKFRKWEDALASLYGKLLLKKALMEFDVTASLDDIHYTRHNKPYLKNSSVCFNISHSVNYVVCAISNEVDTIGVDVEEIKKVDFNEFPDIWTEEEWKEIQENGINIFYQFWARKEAVIKADGRGLELQLEKIDVRGSKVKLFNENYFLKKLNLHVNYVLYLASKKEIERVDLVRLFL